jgi:transcriptional regulator of heat shock response
MEERTKLILKTIISEHIKTGAPVGSEILVEKYKLNISAATVRNEMAGLEENGYIRQPHTSAGRIPTTKAYQYFIETLKIKKLSAKEETVIAETLGDNKEIDLKKTAKVLAHLSNSAVFWAFYKNNLFYTGISNLLSQPEFSQNNLIYRTGAIIDRLDEIMDEIFDSVSYTPEIKIGEENPFGNFFSTVICKYKLESNIGVFGLLGPMRMDYEKNSALVNFIANKFQK